MENEQSFSSGGFRLALFEFGRRVLRFWHIITCGFSTRSFWLWKARFSILASTSGFLTRSFWIWKARFTILAVSGGFSTRTHLLHFACSTNLGCRCHAKWKKIGPCTHFLHFAWAFPPKTCVTTRVTLRKQLMWVVLLCENSALQPQKMRYNSCYSAKKMRYRFFLKKKSKIYFFLKKKR